MIGDARTVPRGTTLETDVCIVGAGAAGISIARELRGTRWRVTVLESGGLEHEAETQALYRGPLRGLPYASLDVARLRRFGGTTNHWAGLCRPFEEADFEPREGIRYTGWPLRKSEIDPFYARAADIVRLPTQDWDLRAWAPDGSPGPLRLHGDRIVSRAAQTVEPDLRSFARRYEEELRQADNVTVHLHANVTGIEVSENGRSLTSLRVATLSGNRFTVRARLYVLATGGIENARLLLASNEQLPAGVGNGNGLVGRFFLEHPRFLAGYLVPTSPHPNLGFYDEHRVDGRLMRGYLASSKAVQLREGLLDLQISLSVDYGDPPRDAAGFARHVATLARDLRAWREITVPGAPLPVPYPEVVRRVLDEPDETYTYLRGKIETIGLVTRIEPAPNPDSRVVLVRERDPLGMQRAALDWRLSATDKRNVRRTLELLGMEVGRAGIGRVMILYDEDEPGWPDDLGGAMHHIGTTRMSNDPKQGVVDRSCRVHGMSNLYVAGSSVFPTAGGATPTFMIVALALRLARDLRAVLAR